MKISLFEGFGALNSVPVFEAARVGLTRLGHTVVSHDMTSDVAVIWSVLWAGKMASNRSVFEHFQNTGRPVIVLEVGMIDRDRTWRVSIFDPVQRYVPPLKGDRPSKLGLVTTPWGQQGNDILIVAQRTTSLQWSGQPTMVTWIEEVVKQIREFSDRKIRVRPHPRERLWQIPAGCHFETPNRITNSYDGYDLIHSIRQSHLVINWNSSPGVVSLLNGVPAHCGPSGITTSLAEAESTPLNLIESPVTMDTRGLADRVAASEWLVEEIAQATPLAWLLSTSQHLPSQPP